MSQEPTSSPVSTADGSEPSSSTSTTLTEDSHAAYSIVMRTSDVDNAETNAVIRVQLKDDDGHKTDRMTLRCTMTHAKPFLRGHSDLFILTNQPSLGHLTSIDITHHSMHSNPLKRAWHLHSVLVLNHENGKIYHFPHANWIGSSNNLEFGQSVSVSLNVVGEPFEVLPEKLDTPF